MLLLSRFTGGGVHELSSTSRFGHLKGGDSGAAGWVRSTVKHIISELDRGGTGAIEVANRLVDVLFLHAVRAFLEEIAESGDSGWLAAIRDQQIGRALAAIHREPHRSWTVESLARHEIGRASCRERVCLYV